MQWDASPSAGFTVPGITPWLPLAADYATRNVVAQENDPASLLNLYRALAALRRAEPALNRGDYAAVDVGVGDVLAYRRTWPGSDGFLVLLNFSDQAHQLDLAAHGVMSRIVSSTTPARVGQAVAPVFSLAPTEGVVIRLGGG